MSNELHDDDGIIPVYGTIPAYVFTEADVNGGATYETPSGPITITPRGQAAVTANNDGSITVKPD